MRGCFAKAQKRTRHGAVGEIGEISADLRALSRHTCVYAVQRMVVSHDRLMRQNLARFVKQPRDGAVVSRAAATLPLQA